MIEVLELSKNFGKIQVINNLNFSLNGGKTVGLLGANGAGKTTLIRMLLGLIIPSSGEILIDGVGIETLDKNMIGYLPAEREIYAEMTVKSALKFICELSGIHQKEDLDRRVNKWLNLTQLEEFEKKKVKDLSTGMKQKFFFAMAVVHEPRLIILDEPFRGLDISAIFEYSSYIEHLRSLKKTIIISSHHIDIVERICDHILFLKGGKLRFNGPLKSILSDLDYSGQSLFNIIFNELRDSDAYKSTDKKRT